MAETTFVRVDRADLQIALRNTLRTIIEARNDRAATERPQSIPVLKWLDLQQPILTPAANMAKNLASLVTHQEAMGILTLRWIGEQLFALGGTKLMQEALEEVAFDEDSYTHTMLDIADKRWDGIGSKSDFWAP